MLMVLDDQVLDVPLSLSDLAKLEGVRGDEVVRTLSRGARCHVREAVQTLDQVRLEFSSGCF